MQRLTAASATRIATVRGCYGQSRKECDPNPRLKALSEGRWLVVLDDAWDAAAPSDAFAHAAGISVPSTQWHSTGRINTGP